MALTIAQLQVKVGGDTKEAEDKLRGINSQVNESGGFFKNALSSALGFAAGAGAISLVGGAVGSLTGFITDSIKAGQDQQAVMSQTDAVIKSTGGAAGMTAEAVGNLADSLARTTPFSDDVTQSAENMLLTFTNIGQKVFPDATKTVLDMSQALGQDTKSSAIQLGKALNDPIAGISALSRVGVTFDQGQKDAIKTMMSTNDIAGAQGIILKELSKEFGKSAEAAGQTMAGKMAILNNVVDQTKEKIGLALIPILQNLMSGITSNVLPIFDKLAAWFIKDGIPAISKLASSVEGVLVPALGMIFTWIGKNIIPVLETFGTFVETKVMPAVTQLTTIIVAQAVPAFEHFWTTVVMKILPIFEELATLIITKVVPILANIAAFVVTQLVPALMKLWDQIAPVLIPIFHELATVITTKIMPALEKIANKVMGELLPALMKLWNHIEPVLIPILNILGWVLTQVIFPAIGIVIGIIGNIIGILIDLISHIVDLITWFFDLADGIKNAVGGALGNIGDFIDKATKFFTDMPAKLLDSGKKWIQGLIDGIKSMAGSIKDAVSKTIGDAVHNIPVIGGLIPGFAMGTSSAPGGMAIVGENGPELVMLPRGAQVVPNQRLSSATIPPMQRQSTPSDDRPVNITITLDGRTISRVLLPHMANEIRLATGTRS